MGIAPKVQASTRGRRATAGRRPAWAADLQTVTTGRRTAGDQRSGPGHPTATGSQPLVAGSPTTRGRRPKVSSPGPAAGRYLRLWDSSNFFEIFLFKKKEFLEVWVMGQGFWENGCRVPPFFEACPYTWKC
jgi:hypothetical protein